MLPIWTERPELTANLLNPAFCAEVMRECVSAYKTEVNEDFPFVLAVFVLPLILNNRIRERLPKTKGTPIHAWINENEEFKIGLARHIANYLPFTQETIMFGIAHQSLILDDAGRLQSPYRKGKLLTDDEEIKSCMKKASTLGKILAKSGNPMTIYSLLGVRP